MKMFETAGSSSKYTVTKLLCHMLGSSLLLFSIPALGQTPHYPGEIYNADGWPEEVALGDVDGDGNLDIVTANLVSGTISVLKSDGSGGFSAKTDYFADLVPTSIALGDLDGDGDLDLVAAGGVAASIYDGVSIMLGDGKGAFAAATPQNYSVGSNVWSVALGDINADGLLDIVTANSGDNTISLLLGDGAGGFTAAIPRDYQVGLEPDSVALGDINEDGKPDVITANYSDGTISILLGDGAGGFIAATPRDHPVSAKPTAIALGDVNKDGGLDVITTNFDSDTISLLLADGAGGLMAKTDYPVGHHPYSIALADMDGDSDLDAVTANPDASSISILLGDGAGAFAPKTDYSAGNVPIFAALGDINNDGALDVVTANNTSHNINILLGNGTGGLANKIDATVGDAPTAVAIGDLNDDGNTDLVTSNANSNNISVLIGDDAGNFNSEMDYEVGLDPQSVALGDLDGNNKLDLVTANSDTNNISVLLNDSTGGFIAATPRDYAVDVDPHSVALGFLNGDSNLDLVTANSGADNISVLLGNGAGGFAAPVIRDYSVGNTPRSVVLGDVNGDSILDLITANFDAASVSILLGDGAGGFTATIPRDYVVGDAPLINPVSIALGDVDADGDLDIATANGLGDSVSILLGDGAAGFVLKTVHPIDTLGPNEAPSAPYSVALHDVDNDGDLDLVTANVYADNVSVLLGNGTGSFTAERGYVAGDAPGFIAVTDINTDNNADLITANSGTDNISILLQNNFTPVAENGVLTLNQDTIGHGTLVATDANGSTLGYSVTTAAQHGTVTLVDDATGEYNYAPATGYHGADSFAFQASDGTTQSNTATVAITIKPTSNDNGDGGSPTPSDNGDGGNTTSPSSNGAGGGSVGWLLLVGLLSIRLLYRRLC